MFVLEEPKSRKRRRTSQEPADVEQARVAKKQKSISESSAHPHHRPPSFWDTLSKIRLTGRALKEFDRRNTQEICQPYSIRTPATKYPTGQARQRLKRFARRGGPDLSHLRGFANFPLPADDTMSNSTNSQSLKRSGSTRSSKISTKSGNFEQKLIDNGIYPSLYEHPNGRLPPKPANLSDIKGRLPTVRTSLSPSRFTDEDFEAFQRENARASSKTTAMNKVIPIIAGNEDKRHRPQGDIVFANLKRFDKDLTAPKPDLYYGAQPSAIHQRVRDDLGKYIIPSKADTAHPAVPNFFLEGKSAQGRADAAKNQALYDGAVGARAMHKLQNFGAEEPVYDNKAYSYPCTYHAGTGTLQIYTMHPTQPTVPGGEPEYHMTQLRSFAMTDTADRFREGATAYRNIRDLAMTGRDGFIDQANRVARQMPPSSQTATFTHSRMSLKYRRATTRPSLASAPFSISPKEECVPTLNGAARSNPMALDAFTRAVRALDMNLETTNPPQ